ncbi:hypothetical protein Tco_0734645 [Tanacetum coccineum]
MVEKRRPSSLSSPFKKAVLTSIWKIVIFLVEGTVIFNAVDGPDSCVVTGIGELTISIALGVAATSTGVTTLDGGFGTSPDLDVVGVID